MVTFKERYKEVDDGMNLGSLLIYGKHPLRRFFLVKWGYGRVEVSTGNVGQGALSSYRLFYGF
ncbi:hypothetical protein [Abyssisolibacter fermentans]|uniref:hypothetical protein n=1 Tax=Abyssisolibacter fermentans TaxID=1766203 RepID=UPI0008347129|nr:hypothetical protein [Abyssisolibacter fermentans]